MRFSGKVVLVSGAGSGLGRAAALAFATEGARVALLGRTLSKLEAVASELPPGRALAVEARHERPAEAGAAVARAVEAFGRLDVLVNNAGTYTTGAASELSFEEWTEALAINLTGHFVLTREALPHLHRAGGGAIVNVASTLGLKPIPGAAAYCAAKAGLLMLTRTTALEEAPHGVRVNAVCPGVVDTPIHLRRAGGDPEAHRRFLESAATMHPLGRIGKPEDVTGVILFLASDAASWMTGSIVTADGGISLT